MIARLVRGAVLAQVFGVMLLSTACDRSARTTPIVKPLAAGAMSPAYKAAALAGDTIAFGGAASTDVVLLNVWATWCTSCKEEFAELERIRGAYAARGLRVVAVSVDQGGDEKVRQFVAAQKSTFPVAHDREAKISALYGVVGLPATYLLSRDGTVAWTLTGSFLVDSVGLARALDRTLQP